MVLDAGVQGHTAAATREPMGPLEVAMGSKGEAGYRAGTGPVMRDEAAPRIVPISSLNPYQVPTALGLPAVVCCKPRRRSVQSAGGWAHMSSQVECADVLRSCKAGCHVWQQESAS